MLKIKHLVFNAVLLGGTVLASADTYREFSFVVDNFDKEDMRVVVEQRGPNGEVRHFDRWVAPGKGIGFNLANGDLHNPDTPRNWEIVRMKLDNIDTNVWFNTVDMKDMFGNQPKQTVKTPRHFLIEGHRIMTFPCARGRGK